MDQELDKLLTYVAEETARYLAWTADAPVRSRKVDEIAASFEGPLPEEGDGALAPLQEIFDKARDGAIHTTGPRFFGFVIGGATPAALAGDWAASALDQNVGLHVSAPMASRLEFVATGWLKELFGLPSAWGGILVTGATMANFTGLACARRWWGLQHGRDVDDDGLAGLGPVPVLSSGYLHGSSHKALAMLGIGRNTVQKFSRDGAGRLDVDAFAQSLERLDGAPAIVIANAGEVNAGDFDPIAEMIEISRRHNTWVHVDGAFGLFGALSPRTAPLLEGVDRADSVASDGHKWLNVPYDCGFAFVRDASYLQGPFGVAAAYLKAGEETPNLAFMKPEASHRARAWAVWATLRAYGRAGYRAMVERHLDLAQRIAAQVDAAPELERLADVKLNIVCFRLRPPGVPEQELDVLNQRLLDALLEDGRVFVTGTVYDGKRALRPALVNWRTQEADVDLLVAVVRQLGAELLAT